MKHIQTTAENPWSLADTKGIDIKIDQERPALKATGAVGHKVDGFGGCFNELGAQVLFGLPEGEQDKLMEALFGHTGCNFNYCRLPIGASDYAEKWYSHNETEGDYAMENFSIERDEKYLIPYIRKAQKLRDNDLTLFASPWSPPTWLKEPQRYNGGSLRDEPEVYKAYADYFLKFVQAYREKGISIDQIHVQNEPDSDQKFPSCVWTGTGMRDFIRDYLGPRFEASGEACEIWAGTIERGAQFGWMRETWQANTYRDWAHVILSDPDARKYIDGVGYQWAGKGALAETRACWPDLPIIQTENECGDGANCWDYAFYVFTLIWHYMNHGTAAYVYWNMILKPGGVSTWGWDQNTMITIDPETKEVTFNPEFYVMKHISNAVKPGAEFIPVEGQQAAFSLLFKNPDGQRVLIIANPTPEADSISLGLDGFAERVNLAPHSLNTLWSE